MKLQRLVALLALCAWTGLVSAQPSQVQDGIEVRPLSRFAALASRERIEQQAAQSYAGLLTEAQRKGALVPDTDPQAIRLQTIAGRIVPFAPRWNPAAANWRWKVVLLRSKQVNAFCMPGGRIAFFTGILDALHLTDDEIAAVMGHEIAHALREHGREQAGKSMATSAAAHILGAIASYKYGVDPHLAGAGANAATQLATLSFSRDDEREADLVGLDLAARAGYDPRAGIILWRKMAALNQRAPIALLSTHPGGAERIAAIEQHLNVLMPVYARSKGTTPDKLAPYRSN